MSNQSSLNLTRIFLHCCNIAWVMANQMHAISLTISTVLCGSRLPQLMCQSQAFSEFKSVTRHGSFLKWFSFGQFPNRLFSLKITKRANFLEK